MLPAWEEAGEAVLLDGLELVAKDSEGTGTDAAQDVRIHPFPPLSAGTEGAFDEAAGEGESGEGFSCHRRCKGKGFSDLVDGEGAVGARVAGDEIADRVIQRFEERIWDAWRDERTKGVAKASGVFDGGKVGDAVEAHLHHATGFDELACKLLRCCQQAPTACCVFGERLGAGCLFAARCARCRVDVVVAPIRRRACGCGVRCTRGALTVSIRFWPHDALRELLERQRTDDAQEIGNRFSVARATFGHEPLELVFDLPDDALVEELAKFDPTKELGEHPRVDGERLGAALGKRRIALVHERADVAEEQRPCERGGACGLGLDDMDFATLDAAGKLDERRQIVDVVEDFADRLENDRELREASRDVEQL